MAEQAKVPSIRFAGFTDPWEQRKLGDVAPLQRGFDLPVNQMTPGPYPVVMSNGIGGWHSKYMVKGPGVVTGRSGTIGSLHYIEQNFWPHNTSLWVTSFNGNEPRFIYWLYASIGLERFGSGSGVPTLNRNDVHDLRVGFPCDVAEQRRIGTFFSRLDTLITLHQRKRQWLKWLDEGGEGTHHDIDILVFKFADDMKISVLCGVHACMTKSLGHTGNRYAGKQQQRGMGVP